MNSESRDSGTQSETNNSITGRRLMTSAIYLSG